MLHSYNHIASLQRSIC